MWDGLGAEHVEEPGHRVAYFTVETGKRRTQFQPAATGHCIEFRRIVELRGDRLLSLIHI